MVSDETYQRRLQQHANASSPAHAHSIRSRPNTLPQWQSETVLSLSPNYRPYAQRSKTWGLAPTAFHQLCSNALVTRSLHTFCATYTIASLTLVFAPPSGASIASCFCTRRATHSVSRITVESPLTRHCSKSGHCCSTHASRCLCKPLVDYRPCRAAFSVCVAHPSRFSLSPRVCARNACEANGSNCSLWMWPRVLTITCGSCI